MMYYDGADPVTGDSGGGGYYGDSGTGEDTGITGGTNPSSQPTYKPTPNGWWEFFGGVWHWMTESPKTMRVG
ncbi:MAG: hypothetical protein ACJ8J0_02615 [Longimicrobiaceae bacterium]